MPKPHPILADLEALRATDGRTPYQLAIDSDLNRQTVGNLLSGDTGGKTVAAIAAMGAALGYRLAWEPLPTKAKRK